LCIGIKQWNRYHLKPRLSIWSICESFQAYEVLFRRLNYNDPICPGSFSARFDERNCKDITPRHTLYLSARLFCSNFLLALFSGGFVQFTEVDHYKSSVTEKPTPALVEYDNLIHSLPHTLNNAGESKDPDNNPTADWSFTKYLVPLLRDCVTGTGAKTFEDITEKWVKVPAGNWPDGEFRSLVHVPSAYSRWFRSK
jgi:hypothetical protein